MSLLRVSMVVCALMSASAAVNAQQRVLVSPSSQVLHAVGQHEHGKINLNRADVKTLAHSFKGIGKKRAEAIVRYRELHGAFRTVGELVLVPCVGLNFVHRHWVALQKKYSVG